MSLYECYCLIIDDILYIYGGYSKEKIALTTGNPNTGGYDVNKKNNPNSNNSSANPNKKESKVHDDCWMLSLKALIASSNNSSNGIMEQSISNVIVNVNNRKNAAITNSSNSSKQSHSGNSGNSSVVAKYVASWQKISKKGNYPAPRCGAVIVSYKNKGLLFGGVYDEEGTGHSMTSTFYNGK